MKSEKEKNELINDLRSSLNEADTKEFPENVCLNYTKNFYAHAHTHKLIYIIAIDTILGRKLMEHRKFTFPIA